MIPEHKNAISPRLNSASGHIRLFSALILFLTLGSESYGSEDYCLGLGEQDYKICTALKSVQRNESCAETFDSNDLMGLPMCLALENILEGKECEGLQNPESRYTQAVCKAILTQTCSTLQIPLMRGFCAFGAYLKTDHPEFMRRREEAKIFRTFLPELENASSEMAEDPIPFELQDKVKNFIRTVYPKFTRYLPRGAQPISRSWFIAYARELTTAIENNKDRLTQLNPPEGKSHYFPLPQTSNSTAKAEYPNAIEVFSKGRIVIHLAETFSQKRRVQLKSLGDGSTKTIYLALDYRSLVSPEVKSSQKSPFLVIGKSDPYGYIQKDGADREEIQRRLKSFQTEYELQSPWSESQNIAPALFFSEHHVGRKYPEMTLGQRLFPADLYDLIEKAVLAKKHGKSPTFGGRSYEKVRVDLALDLLNAIVTLHQNGIHHRDIRPENILIDYTPEGYPRAFITDFGAALQIDDVGAVQGEFSGSYQIRSPETFRFIQNRRLKEANTNLKNDIWSIGLLLNEFKALRWWPFGVEDYFDFSEMITELYTPAGVSKFLHLNLGNPPEPGSYEEAVLRMLSPTANLCPAAEEAYTLMQKVRDQQNLNIDPDFGFRLSSGNR